ncbi:MAG: hypothetical protein ACREOJ_09910, partial [Gemmatimonadaceae bacterium]
MRHPATQRLDFARLVFALLCLACTGAFAAARDVVRMDAVSGAGWMAAAPNQYLAPSRTPETIGLLRDSRRVDTRAQARLLGLLSPPHSASRFLLAAGAVAPRGGPWATCIVISIALVLAAVINGVRV